MKILAVAAALSTTMLAALPAHGQTMRGATGVDAVFARYSGQGVPGCAVAVEKDGATVLERAYGMADIEHKVPAKPGSIYEAGSVAKQFTAAAIVLLAMDGKLSLDDDIRKYLPEMPDYGAPVTVEQLIQHTSGLRDWGSVAGMAGWPRNSRNANNDDVLAIAAAQRGLNFAPDAHYNYSNSNFNLAAIIVARVSGQSFAAFTKARMFDPLGMTQTSWRERYQHLVPGRAMAYAREGGAYVIDQPIEDAHGNGGLLTTVGDLLLWNAALEADTLGAGFRERMEKRGVLSDGTTIDYAAGLRRDEYKGVAEVAHSGSTGGYRAWLGRYPSERLSVALLCNASDADPVDTGRRVAALFLPDKADPPAFAPRGALPQGMYVSETTGFPIRIAATNGGLTLDGAPMTPVAANRWRRSGQDYVFDRNGGLVVEANGERLRHRRVDPVTTVDPAPYAGRYCGADNPFCMIVSLDGEGGLSIATTGRPGLAPRALQPAFADVFQARSGVTVTFVRDAAGSVTGLRYGDGRAYAVEFTRED